MEIPDSAARHAGAFHLDDLPKQGQHRRLLERAVARGEVRRLYPRVYASEVAAQRDECWWHGALLHAGESGALARWSAAELHGLGSWQRRGRNGFPVVEIVLSDRRDIAHNDRLKVHRPRTLPASQVTHRRGLRVTTVERTVLDLVSELSSTAAINLVADVLQSRRTTRARLAETVLAVPRAAGAAKLRGILRRVGPHDSGFELELADTVRKSSLPEPEFNVVIETPNGPRRVDIYWRAAKVAVEADGARFHIDPTSWAAGFERDDDLAAVGVETVHVTYDQHRRDPARVIARIEAVLRRRWPPDVPWPGHGAAK